MSARDRWLSLMLGAAAGAAAHSMVRARVQPSDAPVRRSSQMESPPPVPTPPVPMPTVPLALRPASSATQASRPDMSLLLAEYGSLRDESTQARQAQQQVFAWSLATFSVFFAAGLALAGLKPAPATGTAAPGGLGGLAFRAYTLIFGLALPGAITASAAVWLGELLRMERVSGFLRGLERLAAQTLRGPVGGEPLGIDALRWETYLVAKVSKGKRSVRAKQRVGYLGGAALYFGALVISEALFLSAALGHHFLRHTHDWHRAAIAAAVAVICVFLVSTVPVGRQLLKMPNQAPVDLSRLDPRMDVLNPVPAQ